MRGSLSLASSWDFFPPDGFMSNFEARIFALHCCILFCHVLLLSAGGLLFSDEIEEEWIWRGEEEVRNWKELREGIMIELYCMRRESIFNKRGENTCCSYRGAGFDSQHPHGGP